MLLQVKGLIKIVVKFIRAEKVLCTFVLCIKVALLLAKGMIKTIVKFIRAEKNLFILVSYTKIPFEGHKLEDDCAQRRL